MADPRDPNRAGLAELPSGPWFRAHPGVVVAAAVGLTAAIFASRLATGDAGDGLLFLFVFPICLLAMSFGARIGLLAGAVSVGLIGLWVSMDQIDLTTIGWISRVGPLLFLGLLLGDAADRLQRADEARQAFELSQQAHRQAVEVNDSLIQGMAAARWALESGRPERAAELLDDTIGQGRQLVSRTLRSAGMGADGLRGDLAPAPTATPEAPTEHPDTHGTTNRRSRT